MINLIVGIIALILLLIVIPYVLIDWDLLLDRNVICSSCKNEVKKRKVHVVLHGMGPESDCWEEYFCKECGAPDCTSFLTKHNIN
jgi:hypothetical protein